MAFQFSKVGVNKKFAPGWQYRGITQYYSKARGIIGAR